LKSENFIQQVSAVADEPHDAVALRHVQRAANKGGRSVW